MFLPLDGQHVGGLFDAVLEARVQSRVLENDVVDVQSRVEPDVEPANSFIESITYQNYLTRGYADRVITFELI